MSTKLYSQRKRRNSIPPRTLPRQVSQLQGVHASVTKLVKTAIFLRTNRTSLHCKEPKFHKVVLHRLLSTQNTIFLKTSIESQLNLIFTIIVKKRKQNKFNQTYRIQVKNEQVFTILYSHGLSRRAAAIVRSLLTDFSITLPFERG